MSKMKILPDFISGKGPLPGFKITASLIFHRPCSMYVKRENELHDAPSDKDTNTTVSEPHLLFSFNFNCFLRNLGRHVQPIGLQLATFCNNGINKYLKVFQFEQFPYSMSDSSSVCVCLPSLIPSPLFLFFLSFFLFDLSLSLFLLSEYLLANWLF